MRPDAFDDEAGDFPVAAATCKSLVLGSKAICLNGSLCAEPEFPVLGGPVRARIAEEVTVRARLLAVAKRAGAHAKHPVIPRIFLDRRRRGCISWTMPRDVEPGTDRRRRGEFREAEPQHTRDFRAHVVGRL